MLTTAVMPCFHPNNIWDQRSHCWDDWLCGSKSQHNSAWKGVLKGVSVSSSASLAKPHTGTTRQWVLKWGCWKNCGKNECRVIGSQTKNSSLQIGTSQFEKKWASNTFCTNPWVMWLGSLSTVIYRKGFLLMGKNFHADETCNFLLYSLAVMLFVSVKSMAYCSLLCGH